MSDFYNTLFSIQVTIVGIGIAAVIAIAQILQPFLTYKYNRKPLRRHTYIAMAVALGSLLATGYASLMLALPAHDFFPNQQWYTNRILENPIAASLILASVPLSLCLLGWFIYKGTRYLVPSEVLQFYIKNYDRAVLGKYLKYRYGQPPEEHALEAAVSTLDEDTYTSRTSEKSPKKLVDYEKRLEQHREMRKTNKGAENPLAPIESYVMQSIQRSDTTLLIRSLMAFEAIYLKDPSSSQYLSYYCDVMRNSVELVITQGLHTSLSHILDSIERVAGDTMSHGQLDILSDVLDLMKDVGNDFRKRDQEALKKLLGIYRDIGERLFDTEGEAKQDRIDDVIRNVSSLGEQLIDDMESFERTPLMFTGYYETPLGSLINCLWGIGQRFDDRENENPMYDSRIFLDAMYVVARSLEDGYHPMKASEQDKEVYRDTYHTLMSEHERIFEIAVRKRSKREATLALIKIKDFLKLTQETYDSNQEEETNSNLVPIGNIFGDDIRIKWHTDTLNSVFRIGVMAARFAEKLGEPEKSFINGTYIDEVLRIIEEYGSGYDFGPEAREALVKCGPENDAYEAVKTYLRNLGEVLETDFGMDLS